jgi:hypothetical protein
MAIFAPGGSIIATGVAGPRIYNGPSPSGPSLTGVSSGFTPNTGMTPNLPPPSAGLAPGGVQTNSASDLSGAPAGSGCTGCGGGVS